MISGERTVSVRCILASKICASNNLMCDRELYACRTTTGRVVIKRLKEMLNVVAAEDDLFNVAKLLVH